MKSILILLLLRTGITGIPHNLSSERLGTGVSLGLYVETSSTKRTNWSLSLDYRKVDNLAMEKMDQRSIVLPDGLIREDDFLTISGFAAFRFGARWNRIIKRYGSGTLKVSLAGFADVMAYTRASRRLDSSRSVLRNTLNEDEEVIVNTGGSTRFASTSREATEDGRTVITGGTGLIYELAAGPQVELGFQVDLTERFSTFSGSSDARLTQVYLGFNYPFSAIKSKK